MWSFCHIEDTVRAAFTHKFLEHRIQYFVRDRWCSHGTRNEREGIFLRFSVAVKAYIVNQAKRGISATYDMANEHLTNIGLHGSAQGLYPFPQFVEYTNQSIVCSIHCLNLDIELIKIPKHLLPKMQRKSHNIVMEKYANSSKQGQHKSNTPLSVYDSMDISIQHGQHKSPAPLSVYDSMDISIQHNDQVSFS